LSVLLDSHERHAATLESLREMGLAIEIGQALPAPLEPSRLLSQLERELSTHFAAEEGLAHYQTIALTRTDLLPRVVDLKADHAGLLRALAHIELIATAPSRWTELPPLVSSLLAALADHERAEADLVEEYLSSDEDVPARSEIRATAPRGERGDDRR
jgi:iron-sulfur cluster repair protein YtfE (RIC family)